MLDRTQWHVQLDGKYDEKYDGKDRLIAWLFNVSRWARLAVIYIQYKDLLLGHPELQSCLQPSMNTWIPEFQDNLLHLSNYGEH